MTRLIDADALQDKMHDECCGECESCKKYIWNGERSLCGLIEEAPTVPLPDFKEGYKQAIRDGKTNYSRPQGEWIEKVERRGCFAGDNTVYSYTCPFCGVKEFKKYPFCHCGADMREADNEVN